MVPTTTEMDPGDTQAQTHWERDLQMIPIGDVVSCPYGAYTDTHILVRQAEYKEAITDFVSSPFSM